MPKGVLRGVTTLALLAVIGNICNQDPRGAQDVENFRLEGVAIWQ
jgi:hypothetical protein